MRDICEVLRQKETEFEQLKKEVEALRIAAPLLQDERQLGQAVPSLAGHDPAMQPKPIATASTATKPVWP